MSQSIQDFFRVAQARGFSRDFMLQVTSIGNDNFTDDDFVYITTKILPDRTISNQAVPYMGLSFNAPGTIAYNGSDGWEVTFRNDLDGIIRQKLEAWQLGVFDDSTSTGNINIPGTNAVIQLNQVDESQNIINTYILYGVYIVSLGSVSYDSEGSGKPTTFTAKLAYQYWRNATDSTTAATPAT